MIKKYIMAISFVFLACTALSCSNQSPVVDDNTSLVKQEKNKKNAKTENTARIGLLKEYPEIIKILDDRDDPDSALEERWNLIVLHHSATNGGSMKAFDNYHRTKMNDPNGVKYHFIIDNGTPMPDGKIEVSSRWLKQIPADHLYTYEKTPKSIAICFVGNFEEQAVTEKQLESAAELVHVLRKLCGISLENVVRHRDIDQTVCPGKNFPYKRLLDILADMDKPRTEQ